LAEERGLARDALELRQQGLFHALLGAAAELVDELHEEIEEGVGDLPAAQLAERGQHRMPDRVGVGAQGAGRLGGGSPPELLHEPGRDVVEEIRRELEVPQPPQLGEFAQDAVEPCPSGIGPYIVQGDRRRCRRVGLDQEGLQRIAGRGREALQRRRADARFIRLPGGAGEALDPCRRWGRDP